MLSNARVTAFVLVALGFSVPQVHAQDENVVAQAKREGKVTWYALPGTREVTRGVMAHWMRRYPEISIEIVEAPGPEQMERARAERRAGRPVGDLISAGDTAGLLFADEGGYRAIDAAKIPNLANIQPRLRSFIEPRGYFVPYALYAYGLLVNTRVLPEKDWPKKWTDLIEPRYASEIAIYDPRRVGGTAVWLAYGLEPLGMTYFEKLVRQDLRIYGRFEEVDTAVVRGERPIGLPGRSRTIQMLKGAPLKWIVPEEGIVVLAVTLGIVKDAPHPAASHLLIDFVLSPEMQKVFADLGDVPVTNGIPSMIDMEKTPFLGRLANKAAPLSTHDLNNATSTAKRLLEK